MKRGSCNFVEKVIHAQNAGAIGVLIANYDRELFSPTAGKEYDELVKIPSALISFYSYSRLIKFSLNKQYITIYKPLFLDDFQLHLV